MEIGKLKDMDMDMAVKEGNVCSLVCSQEVTGN